MIGVFYCFRVVVSFVASADLTAAAAIAAAAPPVAVTAVPIVHFGLAAFYWQSAFWGTVPLPQQQLHQMMKHQHLVLLQDSIRYFPLATLRIYITVSNNSSPQQQLATAARSSTVATYTSFIRRHQLRLQQKLLHQVLRSIAAFDWLSGMLASSWLCC